MTPQQLKDRIVIQAKSVTRDAMGGEIVEWVTQREVWAEAEPLRGREYFAAHQIQSEVTVRFRLRHDPRITSAHRVLWNDEPYDIVSAIHQRKGWVTELMCQPQLPRS